VRGFIEERFQCEIFDAYGSAERTLFATECERHDGLHMFEEYGITEIVDGDGHRLPNGDSGKIVATSLHNRATPLIRYACGDIGTISETPCSCGRSHPLFEDLTTREEDILVLPDGRLLPPLFLLSGYGCITGIRKAQVLQNEPSAIHIKLETDHPLIAAEVALLRDYLTKRLGSGVRITLERVDEIPLSPLGKFRRVISTVPLPGNNGFGRAAPPQDPSDNHA
jgi:phenylacetate-CoA ligase